MAEKRTLVLDIRTPTHARLAKWYVGGNHRFIASARDEEDDGIYLELLLETNSRDELKIWMDCNGLKFGTLTYNSSVSTGAPIDGRGVHRSYTLKET